MLVLMMSGFFKNTEPLYGEFTYKNADGSMALIVLTEDSVYCENVNYESPQVNAAFLLVRDEIRETERKIDMHEFEELQKEYIAKMNFKEVFDGKYSKIKDIRYNEKENQYYYEVPNPETGSYGLQLCFDVASKTLSCGNMEFKYSGNKKGD
jgi:hypothetical protein